MNALRDLVAVILLSIALLFCGCSRDLTVRTSALPREADAVELRSAALTVSGEIFDTDGGRKGFVFVDEASASLVEGARVVALHAGCAISQGMASILGAGAGDVEMGSIADCGANAAMPEPATAQPEMMPMPPPPPPKPADTDGDGVEDRVDRCVDVPAGRTPDPDHSGCPDPDADGDSWTDHNDVCRFISAKPWPSSSRPGCPQPDQDGDSIGDEADKCPTIQQGATPSTQKPGCPAPRTLTLTLSAPTAGPSYALATSWDYFTERYTDGELTFTASLPDSLKGAATYSLKFSTLSADIAWDAPDAACAGTVGDYWATSGPPPIGSELIRPCRQPGAMWKLGAQTLVSYSGKPSTLTYPSPVGWVIQGNKPVAVTLSVAGRAVVTPTTVTALVTATW